MKVDKTTFMKMAKTCKEPEEVIWDKISTVLEHYPSFDGYDNWGAFGDMVHSLYTIGREMIFLDMYPRAKRIQDLKLAIMQAQDTTWSPQE